jgi:hypothetical protein
MTMVTQNTFCFTVAHQDEIIIDTNRLASRRPPSTLTATIWKSKFLTYAILTNYCMEMYDPEVDNSPNYPNSSSPNDVHMLGFKPENFTISNAAERDLLLSIMNPGSNEELYNVNSYFHQLFTQIDVCDWSHQLFHPINVSANMHQSPNRTSYGLQLP